MKAHRMRRLMASQKLRRDCLKIACCRCKYCLIDGKASNYLARRIIVLV